jgi:hypothetical protein
MDSPEGIWASLPKKYTNKTIREIVSYPNSNNTLPIFDRCRTNWALYTSFAILTNVLPFFSRYVSSRFSLGFYCSVCVFLLFYSMLLVLKLLGWSVHCTVSEAGGIEPIVPMDYTLRQLVNVFMNAYMYPICIYNILA